MIQTEAPGKLILLGEYAVLFGAPALVTAVDRRARVSITPAPGFHLDALGVQVSAKTSAGLVDRDPRFALVAAVLEEVLGDSTLPAAAVTIDTSEFYRGDEKLGLGSSAAVAVSLAEALHRLLGETSTSRRRFAEAYRAHRRAQGGVGSGVDIAASAWGGVFAYRAPGDESDEPESVQSLSWPRSLHWRVYWTGRSASTPTLVSAVNKLRESEPALARERLDRLTRAAYDGAGDFRSGNVPRFLENVRSFRQGLESLGEAAGIDIVSAPHRRLSSIASQTGAVYKPSGAGAGDIGVAFAAKPIVASPETVELHRAPPIEETR